jgi:hypothetical protein
MYKIKRNYKYTKGQEALIRLQKEYEALNGIVPKNVIERVGLWLQRKGVEWQIKGWLIKSKNEKNSKDI